MKLTKSQNEVLENAKRKIDFSKTHTLFEWALKERHGATNIDDCIVVAHWQCYGFKTREQAIERVTQEANRYVNDYAKYYEMEKENIVLCRANSSTLKALEKMGLIEIIKDGKNYIDTIKILNY